MTKIKWFVLVFLLFAGLGYLREFFFVNLNVILFEKYYHSVSPVPVPSVMDIFRQFSYASLYYSKYLYTLIWVLIFFGASLLSLKKLTRTPFLIRLLVYIYGLLLLLAALSMRVFCERTPSGRRVHHQPLVNGNCTISYYLLNFSRFRKTVS
jgi:hypothetical protein